MKNLKLILIAILAVSAIIVSMSSCSPDTSVELDKTLLYGKWQEINIVDNIIDTTLNFEVYDADGTGYTWNKADDVTEAEAQKFIWAIEDNILTIIHIMEMGGNIPKKYTITKLTTTELSYEDDFGKTHTFIKYHYPSPDPNIKRDPTLLYGKWQETNSLNFKVYKANGTGYTWDEADDVTEAEADPFTWTLEKSILTNNIITGIGAEIPKVYTITKLTATELSYEDDFRKTHTFSKIQ